MTAFSLADSPSVAHTPDEAWSSLVTTGYVSIVFS